MSSFFNNKIHNDLSIFEGQIIKGSASIFAAYDTRYDPIMYRLSELRRRGSDCELVL
jgi:hypothetical protein